MEEVTVRVETDVNLTEDEAKVEKAMANMFDGISMQVTPGFKGGVLVGEAKGREALVKFRNLLRSDRIRDAARRALFGGVRDKAIRFCLNKQVAFAGHVSFCEEFAESTLGPLRVTIECEDPRLLVEWLAERSD
jgi:predicted RNA binding protein with dsRBD fold (UPF0201 family)